tara:strand:+ start:245 stop:493 length:249 start_codon:yes stop_codon:yes gene_type:complete
MIFHFTAENFYRADSTRVPDKYINPLVEVTKLALLLSELRFVTDDRNTHNQQAPTPDGCLTAAVEMWKHVNPFIDFSEEIDF